MLSVNICQNQDTFVTWNVTALLFLFKWRFDACLFKFCHCWSNYERGLPKCNGSSCTGTGSIQPQNYKGPLRLQFRIFSNLQLPFGLWKWDFSYSNSAIFAAAYCIKFTAVSDSKVSELFSWMNFFYWINKKYAWII